MIDSRIKMLRETAGMTQSELSRRLGVTRSGVNAWEMGISVPSTQYIVELALLFNVSSDFLLGIENTASVNITGLDEKDIQAVISVVNRLREHNRK